eukprot:11214475-Lingulodinium_polyedra.AAC.1
MTFHGDPRGPTGPRGCPARIHPARATTTGARRALAGLLSDSGRSRPGPWPEARRAHLVAA